MATFKADEKATAYHSEVLSPVQTNEEFPEKLERQPTFDYSGAHRKTDPKEIALVKKLDWYIMPMSVHAVTNRRLEALELTCIQAVGDVLVELP